MEGLEGREGSRDWREGEGLERRGGVRGIEGRGGVGEGWRGGEGLGEGGEGEGLERVGGKGRGWRELEGRGGVGEGWREEEGLERVGGKGRGWRELEGRGGVGGKERDWRDWMREGGCLVMVLSFSTPGGKKCQIYLLFYDCAYLCKNIVQSCDDVTKSFMKSKFDLLSFFFPSHFNYCVIVIVAEKARKSLVIESRSLVVEVGGEVGV